MVRCPQCETERPELNDGRCDLCNESSPLGTEGADDIRRRLDLAATMQEMSGDGPPNDPRWSDVLNDLADDDRFSEDDVERLDGFSVVRLEED